MIHLFTQFPHLAEFVQQLINGLSLGAIYALIAVGYTMVYGVLRLINFAHGDIYMIGAMTGIYAMTQRPDWSGAGLSMVILLALSGLVLLGAASQRWRGRKCEYLVVIALLLAEVAVLGLVPWRHGEPCPPSWLTFVMVLGGAMLASGLLGYQIEFIAYRPLRNQPRINALITAIGVSMFLEFGGQRYFGATPQAFPQLIPGLEQHPDLFKFGPLVIPKVDTLILCVALLMMFALRHIVMKTRVGMALRAVSHRFDTAALMGVDVNRIVSFTFVLGSILAGTGGILVAMRSPKVDPIMGLLPGLKAFVAAVLGGIGSIPGAVAGAFLLGITEVMVAGYFPHGSQYRDGVAFVILIGVLLVKPSGLFGSNASEKV